MNFQSPYSLHIDLLRFVSVIRTRKPKLLKSGLPGKRTLQNLNQSLRSPLDIDGINSFEKSGYLLFVYELAYQLDLFLEKKNQLYLHEENCSQFFDLSIEERRQKTQKAYLNMILWNEFVQLDHIIPDSKESPEIAPPVCSSQLIKARKSLFQFIESHKGKTFGQEELVEIVKSELFDLLQLAPTEPEQPYPRLKIITPKDEKAVIATQEDWASIEGSFLLHLFRTSMAWLGFTRELDPSAESSEFLILDPEVELQELPESSPAPFLIQANLEIMAFPGYQFFRKLYQLEKFCKPVGGEQILRYKLDKEYFLQALRNKVHFEQCTLFLKENSQVEIPDSINQILKSWDSQSNQIIVSRNGSVIEVGSTKEMEDLLSLLNEEITFYSLDELHLFIPAYDLREFQRLISSRPSQQLDYHQPPPRSIDVQSDLKLKLDKRKSDLFAENFLRNLSDPIEEDEQTLLFQLDQENLVEALSNGLDFDELLSFLEQRSRVFSSTAQLRLETLTSQIGPIFSGQVELLLTPDEKTLDRILHEGGLGIFIKRIGPTAALLAPETLEKAQELLSSYGLPNQQELSLKEIEAWTSDK